MGRYLLLIVSVAALGIMLFFALTDTAWQMGGRQSEDYPEIGFVVFGLPAALIAIAAAGLLARWAKRPGTTLTTTAPLAAVAILALLVCGLLAVFGTGSLALKGRVGDVLIGGVMSWSAPVLFTGLIVSGLFLRRANQRAARKVGALGP